MRDHGDHFGEAPDDWGRFPDPARRFQAIRLYPSRRPGVLDTWTGAERAVGYPHRTREEAANREAERLNARNVEASRR